MTDQKADSEAEKKNGNHRAEKKIYRAECMGYKGKLGDVAGHVYLRKKPAMRGSTGLCPDCLKKYRIELQMREKK